MEAIFALAMMAIAVAMLAVATAMAIACLIGLFLFVYKIVDGVWEWWNK